MSKGYRIVHDSKIDIYRLVAMGFRDDAQTDWYAFQVIETLAGEMQEALKHAVIEITDRTGEDEDGGIARYH